MSQVRPATRSDVDACARVRAAAFQDDPGTIVFEPDPDRRAEILPAFFRSFVAASLLEGGGIMVSGDPVSGVASWFGPERHGPSPDAMGTNGFGDVLERSGPEASQRLLAMVGEIEAQHAHLAPGEHLRLQFYGVEPAHQRSGIGSTLIDHGHRRADELGLPCYLETFAEANVRFYERRGYAIAGEFTIGDGTRGYGMLREPESPVQHSNGPA
jgi:ribosomal protein S18 acetylase RimI-like enzyme